MFIIANKKEISIAGSDICAVNTRQYRKDQFELGNLGKFNKKTFQIKNIYLVNKMTIYVSHFDL